MNDRRYMIRVTNSAGKEKYYSSENGYGFFTFFEGKRLTLEEANDIIFEMSRPNRPDGTPNMLAQSASDVTKENSVANIWLEIIEFVPVSAMKMSLEVRNTTREVEARREEERNAVLAKLSPADRKALGF